jgi:diacylglycerol O-acyltransferase 1
MLHPSSSSSAALPEIYSECPYPTNIYFYDLCYFWWAPTLVYQPVYPRTDRVRWIFVLKRFLEVIGLTVFIWLILAQYASPLLRNSLDKMAVMDIASITERLMKLSTISLIAWLAGFFALFQSFLNLLAELLRFGDRNFYDDWWNSTDVKQYWSTWNKPVYHFMRRHIFSPLVGRGWSQTAASAMVFVFSGVLHELVVGEPSHNILGVAFLGMVMQLPLIKITAPLAKIEGITGKVIGNCIFWISFVLIGQPLAVLLYFFAWQAKYGSLATA